MITQNVKIYRLNKNYYRFAECASNIAILKKAVEIINEKRPTPDRVTFDELSKFEEDGLKYYLFVHRHKEKKSEWAAFFPQSLSANWDFNLQNISIILFVDNEVDMFVIIGGNAFQQIVTFIDHSFGLRLLSKIISPEKDQILSINARGIIGIRSGISEQYRDEIRVADFAKFGKLPTEVHLTLSQEVSDEFFSFLKNDPKEKIKIHVGKSFKIKKSMSFDELKKTILEIGYMMELEEQEYLSSYIQESNNRVIAEDFQPLLIEKIFNDFFDKKRDRLKYVQRFKFDFCNPNDIVGFYSADRYVLTEKIGDTHRPFDETNDKDKIYDIVLDHMIKKFPGETKLFDFRAYVQGIRVRAYQDGKKICTSSFLYHFTSEFMFDTQTVFLVDNKWYRIKYSFLQDLKSETLSLLKRYKLSSGIFDLPYIVGLTEYEHNIEYNKVANYFVFDTITPQGIELCDVLFSGEETTYLIHVKKGFDNSMRELTNQINLAARRLNTDLKSKDKEYLKAVWQAYLKKYKYSSTLDFNQFLEFFEKKNCFCFSLYFT